MPKHSGSRNPDDTSGAVKSEPQLFGIGTFSEPRLLTRNPAQYARWLSGLLGRMGGPLPRSWAFVGLPSCFLLLPSNSLFGLLGRMGGPRPRSWSPVGLPSCFLLSALLGRMGGPRPRSWARIGLLFWAPGSDGWASWAPVELPSCFLLSESWVGWGGPQQRSWAPIIFPFWAPGSDGWAAAKKLGSHWAPFLLPF